MTYYLPSKLSINVKEIKKNQNMQGVSEKLKNIKPQRAQRVCAKDASIEF